MDGDAYFAIMTRLGHNHRTMAEALGISKWCSVAWRRGRRNIPPIARIALHDLLLRDYAGKAAIAEVDAYLAEIEAPKTKGRGYGRKVRHDAAAVPGRRKVA